MTARAAPRGREHGMYREKYQSELVDELKEKRYKAKLVRRVNIPKGEGKTSKN